MKLLSSQIKREKKIQLSSLQELIDKKILALVIDSFSDSTECQNWILKTDNVTNFTRYCNAPNFGVSKIGMTLFETMNHTDKLSEYFETSQKLKYELKQIYGKGNSPLCKITKALNEIWPKGLELAKLNGKNMCGGIIRRIEKENNKGLPPHQDIFETDIKSQEKQLESQLALNLYMKTPKTGGELEVWPVSLTQEEVDELYTKEFDFIDVTKLPKPVRIKPEQGTLIIFRSDCIHSVAPGEGDERLAASFFLGYNGINQPLCYWS